VNDREQRIDSLLNELLRLSDAELRLLHLGWEEVDPEQRDLAWQTVRGVTWREPGKRLMENARSTLAKWVNNSATWTGFGFSAVPTSTGSGMNMADVRREALPAVLDAVGALIAEDELAADQREVLLAPWQRVAPQGPP